ncbi:hypothetical protein GUJ93_ZPchr0003g17309 [Zizania palustris]|uniref:BHLH domain-containing protein n=1 Tax=Zizania palustris TaxID=103762 RepID=A0A8J5STU8_ZIZPA|nr:hypothetical protein GUJ93_ZPchr0003g17309 [Zizania palustris]
MLRWSCEVEEAGAGAGARQPGLTEPGPAARGRGRGAEGTGAGGGAWPSARGPAAERGRARGGWRRSWAEAAGAAGAGADVAGARWQAAGRRCVVGSRSNQLGGRRRPSSGMAEQSPQGSEEDFFDQFFSLTNSFSGAAAGGRPAGDQPFSLALSLDAAADAEALGSGKRLGGVGEEGGGKAERETVQLPGLFPPVFGGGVQPPHLCPSPPTQVFRSQQSKQGGAAVGTQPPAPRPKVRARRGQATDPHSIAERLRRERIAERMRALQELVPNTNKTDRAAMLDEILDYVKFLRLQVKVLSMSRLGGAGAVAQLVADIPLSVKSPISKLHILPKSPCHAPGKKGPVDRNWQQRCRCHAYGQQSPGCRPSEHAYLD